MKKDLFFAPLMLAVGVALFLLKKTGMTVHVAISVVGAVVLLAYTVTTKKEWKVPALEAFMRAMYGIALITGIVLKIAYISFLGIAHKIGAILFVIALVILIIQKLLIKNKN